MIYSEIVVIVVVIYLVYVLAPQLLQQYAHKPLHHPHKHQQHQHQQHQHQQHQSNYEQQLHQLPHHPSQNTNHLNSLELEYYAIDHADTYPIGDADNYALSHSMVNEDVTLPDVVHKPRHHKHYPQKHYPIMDYALSYNVTHGNSLTKHPNFDNSSSMLYYSGLPTSNRLNVDWSHLM